jgi:hypothetical protein
MRNPRKDIALKIEWADHRIQDFKRAFAAFKRADPYSLKVDVDPNTRKPLFQITKACPIPPDISLVAGDAIQNLRTALDYLACGLVLWNNQTPTTKTEFPIFDHAPVTAKDKARFNGKIEGMRQEAINAIWDIHPYQGGDNTLWRLHRLNRIDKHNMLITAWGAVTGVNSFPAMGDQWVGNQWAGVPGVPFPLKQDDKFFLDAPDVDEYTNLFLEVAFNEPGVAEGYPVLLALRQMFRRVNKITGDLIRRFATF